MRLPLVSVCIPTWNGARWLAGAMESALAQSWSRLEVLVVDDASSDESREIAVSFRDPRVRVVSNERRLGLVRNWNRALALAHGEFVKLLFQDDILHPHCVEEMLRPALEDERVGLVFAPREILLDDPADADAVAWREEYGTLHHRFETLGRHNLGRALLRPWLHAGFRENWVGEPTCTLLRSSCLETIGGFNVRMFQGPDFEMWIRLMFFFNVGFVETAQTSIRFHRASSTWENDRLNNSWLDMLWLVEGLRSHVEIRREFPELRRIWLLEAARVVKRQWERLRRGSPVSIRDYVRSLDSYLGWKLASTAGRAPALHAFEDLRRAPVEPPAPPASGVVYRRWQPDE